MLPLFLLLFCAAAVVRGTCTYDFYQDPFYADAPSGPVFSNGSVTWSIDVNNVWWTSTFGGYNSSGALLQTFVQPNPQIYLGGYVANTGNVSLLPQLRSSRWTMQRIVRLNPPANFSAEWVNATVRVGSFNVTFPHVGECVLPFSGATNTPRFGLANMTASMTDFSPVTYSDYSSIECVAYQPSPSVCSLNCIVPLPLTFFPNPGGMGTSYVLNKTYTITFAITVYHQSPVPAHGDTDPVFEQIQGNAATAIIYFRTCPPAPLGVTTVAGFTYTTSTTARSATTTNAVAAGVIGLGPTTTFAHATSLLASDTATYTLTTATVAGSLGFSSSTSGVTGTTSATLSTALTTAASFSTTGAGGPTPAQCTLYSFEDNFAAADSSNGTWPWQTGDPTVQWIPSSDAFNLSNVYIEYSPAPPAPVIAFDGLGGINITGVYPPQGSQVVIGANVTLFRTLLPVPPTPNTYWLWTYISFAGMRHTVRNVASPVTCSSGSSQGTTTMAYINIPGSGGHSVMGTPNLAGCEIVYGPDSVNISTIANQSIVTAPPEGIEIVFTLFLSTGLTTNATWSLSFTNLYVKSVWRACDASLSTTAVASSSSTAAASTSTTSAALTTTQAGTTSASSSTAAAAGAATAAAAVAGTSAASTAASSTTDAAVATSIAASTSFASTTATISTAATEGTSTYATITSELTTAATTAVLAGDFATVTIAASSSSAETTFGVTTATLAGTVASTSSTTTSGSTTVARAVAVTIGVVAGGVLVGGVLVWVLHQQYGARKSRSKISRSHRRSEGREEEGIPLVRGGGGRK